MDLQLAATANLFMKRAYESLMGLYPEATIDAEMLRNQVCMEIDNALRNSDDFDMEHIRKEAQGFINKTRWKYCLRVLHHSDGGVNEEIKQFFSRNEDAVDFLKQHGFSIQILSKRWYRCSPDSKEFDTATVSRI